MKIAYETLFFGFPHSQILCFTVFCENVLYALPRHIAWITGLIDCSRSHHLSNYLFQYFTVVLTARDSWIKNIQLDISTSK